MAEPAHTNGQLNMCAKQKTNLKIVSFSETYTHTNNVQFVDQRNALRKKEIASISMCKYLNKSFNFKLKNLISKYLFAN